MYSVLRCAVLQGAVVVIKQYMLMLIHLKITREFFSSYILLASPREKKKEPNSSVPAACTGVSPWNEFAIKDSDEATPN